jgi:hypothetical protein
MTRRTKGSTAARKIRGLALPGLVGLGAILAGCGATGPSTPAASAPAPSAPAPSPTQSPTVAPQPSDIPSPACGFFQVEIRNTGTHAVQVLIDGVATATVEPGTRANLDQDPPPGNGPWHVEIVDPASGTVVGAEDIGPDVAAAGMQVEVRDGEDGKPAMGATRTGTAC